MTTRNLTILISAIGFPIAIHITILLKNPVIGFIVMVSLISLHTFFAIFRMQGKVSTRISLGFLILATLSILVLLAYKLGPQYPLFIPTVVINSILFFVFFKSLLPGHTPIISYISKLERGSLTEELVRYTRGLTWVWAMVFLGLLLESILLAVFAPLEIWSLFTNILNYVFVAALFFGEYIFRLYHFRHLQHKSPIRVMLSLARQGVVGFTRS